MITTQKSATSRGFVIAATGSGSGSQVLAETGLSAGDIQVDLSGFPAGAYTVVESGETLLVDEAVSSGMLGVIELFLDTHPESPAQPEAFSLAFEARAEVWKYYVVFAGTAAHNYEVQNLAGYTFDLEDDIASNGSAAEQATAAALKTGRFASSDILLFRSNGGGNPDEVPYSENVIAGITLEDTTESQTLISSLPNPSVRNATADMVVYVNEES